MWPFADSGTIGVPDPRIRWPDAHAPTRARVFAQNVIEIGAPPDRVWSLLIDCVAWPNWYAHCSDVSILSGAPTLGSESVFRFKTLGRYFEPVVRICEPTRLLLWSASGPAGTSGSHAWYVEPVANGCRVFTEEAQTGLLLALVGRRIRGDLLRMHQDWLEALKALAET